MKNQSYFIKNFPDYRLVRLSESKFCVLSKRKKDYWEEIGYDDGNGHIHVTLYGDYVRHTQLHVIVAETFVPNPDGKTVVHHIDGDATNNDPANNLMWVTTEEHAEIHHKGVKRSEETRKKMSAYHNKPIEQWSKDNSILIAKYLSAKDAAKYTGVHHGNISLCCNGKRPLAGGYKWKYC